MSEQIIKMQQDLEKKLDHLCFIYDQPKLHLVNEFYELRNSIDIDAEELLARFLEVKLYEKANKTRTEFIRILRELEERFLSQLPKANTTSASKAYGHFRRRVGSLKHSTKDRYEETYTQLALEIIEETYELEKRLFDEQTIVYVSSSNKTQLGHLVYLGEDRLKRHEIECLQHWNPKTNIDEMFKNTSLLGGACFPFIVTKNYMLLSRLQYYFESASAFSTSSKFIYMGKDEVNYAGYPAENINVDKEFVSIRFPVNLKILVFREIAGISSCLDLPGLMIAEKPAIEVFYGHLESLDFLASSSSNRLSSLSLEDVHLESFDGDLIGNCVNLRDLILDLRISSATFSNLDFIRRLKRLESLTLSMPSLDMDLSAFEDLENVCFMYLKGSAKTDVPNTYTEFNIDLLKHLSALPYLNTLILSKFEIESISKQDFADFKATMIVYLKRNKIGSINKDVVCNYIQLPLMYIT